MSWLGDWFSDFRDSFFGNPSQAWDRFKNGRANEINQEIAEENLEYQRERNAIEDARYEEETAYNRAFAEDERAYNRALQQQLFEREDTAFSRQAADLARIGINPLSLNLNGAGAGQVVSSAVAPTPSSRAGEALHNGFNAIPGGIEGALSALSGIADTVNGVATGQYQRDSLALQNDARFLENYKLAHSLGLDYGQVTTSKKKRNTSTTTSVWDNDTNTSYSFLYPSIGQNPDFMDSRGNYFREESDKKRQLEGKGQAGLFDWESNQTKLIKSLGTLDFQNLAENLLTNVANAGNWVNGNLKDFAKDMNNNAIMDFVKKFFAF